MNDKWILCSERMPEENFGASKMVLVTIKRWGEKPFTSDDYTYCGEWVNWRNEEIIAWMPMPEPYEE